MLGSLPGGGRRARSADDRSHRRQSLIDAARRRLADGGFESFTMADLAREAGVAKGTSYLYFETKEELLLALLTIDLAIAFEHLASALPGLPEVGLAEHTARSVADALDCVPGLLGLLQLLHTRLERNVTVEALREFKEFLLAGMSKVGRALESRLGLSQDAGLMLLQRAHALAIGFAQMADIPPQLAQVYQAEPKLSVLAVDFDFDYVAALADLIRAQSKKVL